MPFSDAMNWINTQLAHAQTLAAVATKLRLQDVQEEPDPELSAQLDRVFRVAGVEDLFEDLSDQERLVAQSFALSFLKQAVDLVTDPARPGAWSHTDPAVLQAQGSASTVVARLIHEAGIGRPDDRILDVGCGVAALSLAFCETYPSASVVGIDPWEPALDLARQNVAASLRGDQVTLVQAKIEDFRDEAGFDLVWFPAFFIPAADLDSALAAVRSVLRPDGHLVVGVSPGGSDTLPGALDDLFTLRAGGSVLTADDAVQRLGGAGFSSVAEIPRTWMAPLALVHAGL